MSDAGQSLRIRRAARILLIDSQDRVLLFRFTPDDRPPLWATPGGECDPDEDFAQAAARELLEETGIVADPGDAIAIRTSQFKTFQGEEVIADERYFIVKTAEVAIDTQRHTATEREVMLEHRWFARSEIETWHEVIYPETLTEMLDAGASS